MNTRQSVPATITAIKNGVITLKRLGGGPDYLNQFVIGSIQVGRGEYVVGEEVRTSWMRVGGYCGWVMGKK